MSALEHLHAMEVLDSRGWPTVQATVTTAAGGSEQAMELIVQALESAQYRPQRKVASHIADLAVGTAAGRIKTGAPCRGERTAKYHRLAEIEREVARHLPLGRSRWSLVGGLRLAAGPPRCICAGGRGEARSARGLSKLPPLGSAARSAGREARAAC